MAVADYPTLHAVTRKQQAMKTTYVTLISYTDQGIRNLKQSPQRAQAFRESAAAAGIKVLAQFWTAGACDGVLFSKAIAKRKSSAHSLTSHRWGTCARNRCAHSTRPNSPGLLASKTLGLR